VGIASTVFDILVLLLLVLLGLHAGLDVYERLRDPTPVYSDKFDLDAYTVADEETAAAIVQEFDLRAAGGLRGQGLGEFDYQPWVGFAERPYSGQYLNVDEYSGYTARRTSPPSQASPEAEELIVWGFGGSTFFGFGMNDDHTPASHLQRELQRLLPSYRVRVVNHAHGWWYSSQEVAHFLALLRIESPPQVVLFLDGVNDVGVVSNGYEPTYYTSVLWDAWQAERHRRRYPAPGGAWLQFTQSFPTTRLQRLLRPTRLTLQALTPPLQHPSRFRSRPGEPARRVLEVYRTNRRIAAGIADAFGIQVHFFLQPTSSVRESADREPRGVYEIVYNALITEARDSGLPHFDTLHDALYGLDKPYIDTIHYNEEASQILGARMAERIAQEWTSRSQ
jgi:hypothetical protein